MKTSSTAASNRRHFVGRHWWLWLLAVYLLLLLASHLVRGRQPRVAHSTPAQQVVVQAVDGDRIVNRPVNLAYQSFQSAADKPALVLLHGSPGQSGDFAQLAPVLAPDYHLLAPDLPGFANSTRDVPDYSKWDTELFCGTDIRKVTIFRVSRARTLIAHYTGLCWTNRVTVGSPLSLDGLIPRLQ